MMVSTLTPVNNPHFVNIREIKQILRDFYMLCSLFEELMFHSYSLVTYLNPNLSFLDYPNGY